MTNEQVTRIQFEWLLSLIVISHCKHEQAKIKIRGALYGLQRQGLVKRVGKDRWVGTEKLSSQQQPKPKET